MTDRFGGFQRSPDGPFTNAVVLVPSDDEFEPTAAILVSGWQYGVMATFVPMDSDEEITAILPIGVSKLRIKKLTFIYGNETGIYNYPIDLDGEETVPLASVVGLY